MRKSKNDVAMGVELMCYQCNKKTWVPNPQEYVYRREKNNKKLWFCGWNCLSEYDKSQNKELKGATVKLGKSEKGSFEGRPNPDLRKYAADRSVKLREVADYLNTYECTISNWLKMPRLDERRRAAFKNAVDEIVKERFK